MSKSKFNPLITASVMSAVYLAGVSNVSLAVDLQSDAALNNISNSLTAVSNQESQSKLPALNAQGQRRYIIRFKEPAVARYNGTGRFAAIPRKADNKIDSSSPAVTAYVDHLKQEQENFLNNLSGSLNRTIKVAFSYQYAMNGMVLELTPAEASAVNAMANVAGIEPDFEYELDTDAGPQLIGADNVWMGTAPASGTAFGEGVVVGILDSGTNFDHPSLADVGADGYDHTNPLGTGNYLGVCDASNTDQFLATYTCNDKIIGGFDFVNAITPADGTDIEGPEDEGGHGTHTSTTAVGNLVLGATVPGIIGAVDISGVARHANLVIFDTCYTPAPGAGGGCFGSAAVASIDQILADGIVDVVNYSISGGTDPWNDSVSLAFLNATDSGVFVSASAGNSGPGPGTLGHVEPWTSSVAASTHTRGIDSPGMSITGPVIDPALEGIPYNTSNGPAAVGNIDAGIQYAGVVDAANFEGCSAFPAMSFDGLVALMSRGSCAFADKVVNAQDAGAVAVVIHNNVPGGLNMNVGTNTTIPSFSINQTEGEAMAAYLMANAGATILIEQPFLAPTQADVVAGFSSRGPSPFEYNKPDVAAPGVQVLAGWADADPATGSAAEFNIISGTSMAAPHNAGAAALMKELHPTWSAPEIKSALMLTAVTAGVTKEDSTTPADPFDRGAGRIQVDVASSTGLVMDETAFRFLMANPATGGDPKTLNVASYKNNNCVGSCSFQRKFTSVAAEPVDYTVSLSGMTGTVSPNSFTAMPGQTVTLNVDIDGTALPAGATSFGELVLTPPNPLNPSLGIPDDGYDGTLSSMACVAVEVAGAAAAPLDMALELGIDHSWVGDLTVKLQNPNGDILGVMSRTAFDEPADDGTGCCGSNSNLSSSDPISFFDAAVVSAEDMPVGFADVNICTDDGICEYSPAPGTVANPPATFAELIATDPNGTWNVCVGDSGSGDVGVLESVGLSFDGAPVEIDSLPELHLPLVVVGFPEQPDITVNPLSLSATLDADMTTDLNLNISNSDLAGADLNWTIGSGAFSLVYAEQTDGTGAITNGIVSGFFLQDNGGAGSGAYSADDFVLTQDASIETMFFEGFANGASLDTSATAIQLQVFVDAAGLPMGHPEDGAGSAIFALDIPIADASLDLTDNNILIDIVAANGGSPLDLPAGTYWVSVFPTQDATSAASTRWAWFAAGPDVAGAPSQLISPISFGVTDWTDIPGLTSEPNFEQLRYNIAGSSQCGAPWITTSVAGSAVAPGADVDVTVTLDSTGLAPGVYNAAICIDSDDPDEPQVVVPVTMTVDGLSDLIFADGFEGTP